MIRTIVFLSFIATTLGSYSNQYDYPCNLKDYACIQEVLAANSDCDTRIWNYVPNKTYRANFEFRVPFTNASYQDQYSFVTNMDQCYVPAFFINRTQNIAVLGVNCPNLELEVIRKVIQHSPNEQNKYYTYKIFAQLPLIQMTANFRRADDIDLCDTFVFSYITGLPQYTVIAQDLASQNNLQGRGSVALENGSMFVRTELLERGPRLFKRWVSYKLCDFYCNTKYL